MNDVPSSKIDHITLQSDWNTCLPLPDVSITVAIWVKSSTS
jgi:hypothetical protein